MTKTKRPTDAPDPTPIGEADAIATLQARIAAMEKAGRIKARDTVDDPPLVETGAEAEARRRAAQAHLNARWAERLPVMYADATLADLEGQDRHLVTWLSNTASLTLVLAGSVGTGKTHAAYAVGNTAVAQGVWAEAWTCADLLEALRPGGDPTNRVAYRVRHCDLLVLDDLGAAKATEWAAETLTAILDHRLREKRRQVVTTNHPYEVLEANWGARLMDRFRYRWTVVTMTGESRRRTPAW